MPRAKKTDRKIFVLDTSVILYEHIAIMNFEEHDIGLPTCEALGLSVIAHSEHPPSGSDLCMATVMKTADAIIGSSASLLLELRGSASIMVAVLVWVIRYTQVWL